jgi:PadR family transcriptional regulator
MPRAPNTSRQTLRVLAALLQTPQDWRHGYDLSKETGLKSGTLYPVLMRLKGGGLLDSEWRDSELPGRPPRHAYRLTQKGRVFTREQVAARAPALRVGATVGAAR